MARVLHARSARSRGGFVRIDSAFHETDRLAEKLRRADGGTLLIKEVAHVGRDPQRVFTPLLQRQGTPDVRVLASTGVDLGLAVEAGRFDADLYQRLGGLRISIPPLRARPEDVPIFAEHFLLESQKELGREDEDFSFSPRALDKLAAYSWPGNVTELRDVVYRLSMRARQPRIDLGDVEVVLPPVHERVPLEQMSFEDVVRCKLRAFLQRMEGYPIKDLHDEVIGRVERPLIEEVLARTGNNQVKAAEILGMNRNTLRKKIQEREVQTISERGRRAR